jgi:hypothetical protein
MTQKIVIIVIVAIAVLLLIRQVYRMVKGKDTGCSCCSRSCTEDRDQCCSDDSGDNTPEKKNDPPQTPTS